MYWDIIYQKVLFENPRKGMCICIKIIKFRVGSVVVNVIRIVFYNIDKNKDKFMINRKMCKGRGKS